VNLILALAVAVLLLMFALGGVGLLWRAADRQVVEVERIARTQARQIRHLRNRVAGYRAELEALSIAGPRIDTTHGSHDDLPIRDDIRATLIDYCEGMWHTTHDREKPL